MEVLTATYQAFVLEVTEVDLEAVAVDQTRAQPESEAQDRSR